MRKLLILLAVAVSSATAGDCIDAFAWTSAPLTPSEAESRLNVRTIRGSSNSDEAGVPRVATISGLRSSPSTLKAVYREGYFTRGDVTALMYLATSAPCQVGAGAGDGGSEVPTSDGKCWIGAFPGGRADVKEFGAKGDGSSDDTRAVQNWVNYLYSNGKIGEVPVGHYKLMATVSAPSANGWGWRGGGKYKSAFFYAGSNPSANIFSFGSGSHDSRGAQFESFSVYSAVRMTGGAAFKLTNFTGATIDDVSFGGELYAANTWHGIWFNGAHEIIFTRFDVQGSGDGVIVNGGSLGNSSNSDLYLNAGYSNNNGGAGIRQAGGFGGLNINQVQLLGNHAGQLIIDNSNTRESNRETILGANFVADGVLSTSDDIILNSPYSSSSNLILAGTVGSAARYGINVISWPRGYVNISSGRIYNNRSDAIHVMDATITFACGSGVTIDTNGGEGVGGSVSDYRKYISCHLFDNAKDAPVAPQGGWRDFDSVLSSSVGRLSNASVRLRYVLLGKAVSFTAIIDIISNGSAGGHIMVSLPVAASGVHIAVGRAIKSGRQLQGVVMNSSLNIYGNHDVYPGGGGESIVVSGTYEAK